MIAVDAAAGTLRVRTDPSGRLPRREVVLTTSEAAGESPGNPVRLGHGYAMTLATSQARGWSDSYSADPAVAQTTPVRSPQPNPGSDVPTTRVNMRVVEPPPTERPRRSRTCDAPLQRPAPPSPGT